MPMKRFSRAAVLCLATLLLAGISGCAVLPFGGGSPAPVPVTILFFNDLHGHLMPFEIKGEKGREEVGGIARMAALIRDIRAENGRRNVRTLVLMAGDMLQGTPMSTVFRGDPDIECLNAMGVDSATVGNHEFDFGLDNFRRLRERAAFPFLSANIVEKGNGRPLCRSCLTIPIQEGLSLTVIGITTEELLTVTLPSNVAALDVVEPVASLQRIYGELRSRGPVVLLSHCEQRTDRRIAEALPDLTAIIGGHDHILLSPYRRVGDVPIFQAFEKGRYLGRIDLLIDPAARRAALTGWAYIPITAAMEPDPQIASIVASYQEKLGSRFKEVIGHADIFLDAERRRIRYEETTMGNFVADSMVEYTGVRIAMINSGSMRASIQKGPVTVEDVLKTLPFANEIVVAELTGDDIEQALQRAVSGSREDEDGGFLQVSGLEFDIRGRSAVNIRVGKDRRPLQPRTLYRVAITDFLATGGDRYAVFKGRPHLYTGLPLGQLIADTVRRRGVISAKEEGRIRRLE